MFYPIHPKGSCINAFYRIVYAEILDMCNSAKSRNKMIHNLTRSEKIALDTLTNNYDLFWLKSADKGGGIVVQNRLLSDTNTYTKLKTDPLPQFTLEATSLSDNIIT